MFGWDLSAVGFGLVVGLVVGIIVGYRLAIWVMDLI